MDGRTEQLIVVGVFLFVCLVLFGLFFSSMTFTNPLVLRYVGGLVTGGSDLKQTSIQGKQVFGT